MHPIKEYTKYEAALVLKPFHRFLCQLMK